MALLAGAGAGAVLVVLWSFWGYADPRYVRDYWRRDALIVFTYAAVVWAAGLLVIAPVPWLMLHRNGWRSWWIAAVLGAGLSFVVANSAWYCRKALRDKSVSFTEPNFSLSQQRYN